MSKESSVAQVERVTAPEQLWGLQGRLVMGDKRCLIPSNTIPENADPSIISFQKRDYRPFEEASKRELKSANAIINIFDIPHDKKMQAWAEETVNTLTRKSPEKWDKVYKRYFDKMNISVDNPKEDFTTKDALQVYEKYFSISEQSSEPQRIKQFVADIMSAYNVDGKLDAEGIQSNISEIRHFAAMFGKKSADMVVQLVLAETRLLTDPTFTQKITEKTPGTDKMRINDLSQEEENLLSFINYQNTEEEFTGAGELPIMKHKEEIQQSVRDNDVTIVIGGTGSGKTVGTPRFVREMLQPGEKFYVTEPTRANTSSIPVHVADLEGVTFGKEIGFEHGDSSNVKPETDTTFGTERKLVMKMIKDPMLTDYSYVMVDEIHVQSMHTEELVAMLRNAQRLRKENGLNPLKIIAASATVNEEDLKGYFGVDKTINVEGRTFPVKHHYANNDYQPEELPKEAAETAKKIHASGKEGDVVIFVSGEASMKATQASLEAHHLDNVKIIPLHSGSSEEQQQEVSKTAEPGIRRIIVATNFAETGVTINGLKFVINTGEEFEQGVDDVTGLTYVKKIKKSQAAINQSSGRVGRNAPGEVYHLYTEANYKSRPKYNTPELQKTDLTPLLLDLSKVAEHVPNLEFMSEFKPNRIAFAQDNLLRLGAINEDGTLTEIGKRMAEIPTDYHAARMIAEAEKQKKGINQIVTIASFGDKSPFPKDPAKREQVLKQFGVEGSDFLTILNIARGFKANGSSREWAEANGLSYQALISAEKTRTKIMRGVKRDKDNEERASNEDLMQIITAGYKDRLMELNPKTNKYIWHRQKADTFTLQISRDSLAKTKELPKYVVSASNSRVGEGVKSIYLNTVQAVKPEWL